MNYAMFFMTLIYSIFLSARTYEDSFVNSFGLKKTEDRVVITLDTNKKVDADDITITHKHNHVYLTIKGLDCNFKMTLEASNDNLRVTSCSEKSSETRGAKKDSHNQVQEYRSFYGSSCMQEIIQAAVDLSAISAEYQETELILSIPLKEQEIGKKIQVKTKQKPLAPKSSKKNDKPIVEGNEK